MTTDKAPATLATAKHGVCVQLGTSERERFEAWAKSRDPDFCIYRDGSYPFEWQGQWEAWQAAQPSPGGQDALLALVSEWRERAEELSVDDAIGLTHQLKLRDCADELEEAISSEKERS